MTAPAQRYLQLADLVIVPRQGGYARGREGHELILRAALGILIDEGYRAMSMRRIAAACDMKLGNLTYYFPTREDLVRELLDAVIRSYEVEFDAIMHDPEATPRERLDEICALILDDITTKKTTRLFPEFWALSNHDPFVLERIQELYVRARAPLKAIIAEINPGLSIDQRQAVALFISASMEGMTVFAGHDKPYEKRMPVLKQLAMKSFYDLVANLKPDDFVGL
ncbi:MAG TPA: TetR/AcrR family transcriptional regulator [Chakrabartia sp.]|jgi:AcrR family transcriptional regulator|nr:TetR/AcrR family transcriptional regulator [Chakrabartia sp.]